MKIAFSIVLSTIAFGFLSACGGGGSDGPSVSDPMPNTGPISTIPSTVLKTLPDGSLAVQFQGADGLAYAGFAENKAIRDVLKNLDYTIASPSSQTAQGSYSQTLVGQSGDGNEITLIANGVFDRGQSVVAVVLVDNENVGRATVAVGPKPVDLPRANVQFTGKAQIFEVIPQSSGVPIETGETGGFVLDLDFSNSLPTGTIKSAGFQDFIFAGTNLVVDTKTGGFSSDQASIGRITGAQSSAELNGQIFGATSNAAGGVIRATTSSPAFYSGVFYGLR